MYVQSRSMYVVCKTENKIKNTQTAAILETKCRRSHITMSECGFFFFFFFFFSHSSTVRKFYNLELKRIRGTLNSNTMDQLSPWSTKCLPMQWQSRPETTCDGMRKCNTCPFQILVRLSNMRLIRNFLYLDIRFKIFSSFAFQR